MLVSHFKKGTAPRESQRFILDEMETFLKSGCLLVRKPTG